MMVEFNTIPPLSVISFYCPHSGLSVEEKLRHTRHGIISLQASPCHLGWRWFLCNGFSSGKSYYEWMWDLDTCLLSSEPEAFQQLVHVVERVAAMLGLQLNKQKCFTIVFQELAHVTFSDGTPIPDVLVGIYFGAYVTKMIDNHKEAMHCVGVAHSTIRKLEIRWRYDRLPARRKSVAALLWDGNRTTPGQNSHPRKILRVPNTHMDRSYTNERLVALLDAVVNSIHQQVMRFMCHLLRSPETDPQTRIIFETRSTLRLPNARRVCRPWR